MKLLYRLLLGSFLILLLFLLRPAGFLLYTYLNDHPAAKPTRSATVHDASKLDNIHVDTIIKAAPDTTAAIAQLSTLIQQAARAKRSISIAGAKHTMGGHTLYPDGILLDMTGFRYLSLDTAANELTAGSGALWADIIPYLDRYGRSVAVMQSNNSFSVGGSISANCHGWQPDAPPISSTVNSFRLINASGEIVTCSRVRNPELFSLVMGGYGLFGVILDVKLKVVPNRNYTARQYIIRSKDYVAEFRKYLAADNVGLAYGRININPDHFMEEAILSTYIDEHYPPEMLSKKNTFPAFRRTVFRASVQSDYGKNLRWKLEKLATGLVNDRTFTRNTLLNEGTEVFENTDPAYTDILHEYFVPPDAVPAFITSLQQIIPRSGVELLNITVRNVKNDPDSFMAYAHGEVFGFVMLFNQKRDPNAEAQMKALTRELIATVIRLKGTYYLPYRLHAGKQQLYQAYPNVAAFFRKKKETDPGLVFRNKFYEAYQ